MSKKIVILEIMKSACKVNIRTERDFTKFGTAPSCQQDITKHSASSEVGCRSHDQQIANLLRNPKVHH